MRANMYVHTHTHTERERERERERFIHTQIQIHLYTHACMHAYTSALTYALYTIGKTMERMLTMSEDEFRCVCSHARGVRVRV